MVWHTNHFDINTGNTFRFGPSLHEFRRRGIRSGTILKTIRHGGQLCHLNSNLDILDDGIVCNCHNSEKDNEHLNHFDEIEYSLNKRKRWLLIDMVEECIKDRWFLLENCCSLVLIERGLDFGSCRPHNGDCIAYQNSQLTLDPIYPNGWFSYATDLFKRGESYRARVDHLNEWTESEDVYEIQYETCTFRSLIPHNNYVMDEEPVLGRPTLHI